MRCRCWEKATPLPPDAINIDKLLPEKWRVTDVSLGQTPYGFIGENSGCAITVTGPSKVKDVKAGEAFEQMSICIMPGDDIPVEPPTPGVQSSSAILLGTTRDQQYRIDVKDWPRVISWPNWQQDIHQYFQLIPPGAVSTGSTGPTGPATGKERVLRGGTCFDENNTAKRAASRARSIDEGDDATGFRCVCVLPGAG